MSLIVRLSCSIREHGPQIRSARPHIGSHPCNGDGPERIVSSIGLPSNPQRIGTHRSVPASVNVPCDCIGSVTHPHSGVVHRTRTIHVDLPSYHASDILGPGRRRGTIHPHRSVSVVSWPGQGRSVITVHPHGYHLRGRRVNTGSGSTGV